MQEINPESGHEAAREPGSGCGCNPRDTYAGTRTANHENPICGCSFVSSRTATVKSAGGYPGACSCRCTGDEHLSAPAQSSNSAAHEGSI
ncbi:hypothetical protein CR161_06925 [Prosthecochloris sp. ZM]|uniref:hypothetical protein n=1 Tax=Prosthecochloris sp. ZM TaxID=2283143 RepID=UPI000DF7F8A5|nr:hypothetical protein [Prosthecochloris sp. ZM]RDD30466.1 hypothetical protein CR161_06925 [Prosthecochloris sp. ZM]